MKRDAQQKSPMVKTNFTAVWQKTICQEKLLPSPKTEVMRFMFTVQRIMYYDEQASIIFTNRSPLTKPHLHVIRTRKFQSY